MLSCHRFPSCYLPGHLYLHDECLSPGEGRELYEEAVLRKKRKVEKSRPRPIHRFHCRCLHPPQGMSEQSLMHQNRSGQIPFYVGGLQKQQAAWSSDHKLRNLGGRGRVYPLGMDRRPLSRRTPRDCCPQVFPGRVDCTYEHAGFLCAAKGTGAAKMSCYRREFCAEFRNKYTELTGFA